MEGDYKEVSLGCELVKLQQSCESSNNGDLIEVVVDLDPERYYKLTLLSLITGCSDSEIVGKAIDALVAKIAKIVKAEINAGDRPRV